MRNTQLEILEQYLQLQQMIASYHVLHSAVRLGVLAALADGQKTDIELAQACGLETVPLRLLLAVLVQTGTVEKYEEHYALAQVARLLPSLEQLDDTQWSGIDAWVRGAGTAGHGESAYAPAPASDPHWMMTPAAMDAAEALDFGGSRTGMRVLEVGGGPCVLSATLAHRDPASQFCVVDLPEGIDQARQTAESVDRVGQFEFHIASPYEPPVDDDSFDLVIIAGVLRRIPEDLCRRWLERLGRLLRSGGELAVLDWFPGQAKGQRNLAFGQLELSLRHRDGGLVTALLLREWLGAAGLGNIRFASLPAPPHTWGLVLAQK